MKKLIAIIGLLACAVAFNAQAQNVNYGKLNRGFTTNGITIAGSTNGAVTTNVTAFVVTNDVSTLNLSPVHPISLQVTYLASGVGTGGSNVTFYFDPSYDGTNFANNSGSILVLGTAVGGTVQTAATNVPAERLLNVKKIRLGQASTTYTNSVVFSNAVMVGRTVN